MSKRKLVRAQTAGPRPLVPDPATQPHGHAILALLGVALTLRLVYLLEFRSSPFFHSLILDEEHYDRWARVIASGDLLGRGAFTANPLWDW